MSLLCGPQQCNGQQRWAVAIVVASVLVAVAPLLGGRLLYLDDTSSFNYPARIFLWRQWRSGDPPLWHPGILCGHSVVGEGQYGAFYPLHLLTLLLPDPWTAYSADFVATLLIAALGYFVLARAMGLSPPAAAVAGVIGGLGGPMIAHHPHIMIIEVVALWPWAALPAWHLAGGRPSAPWVAMLAAFFCLQVLAFHPQMWLFGAVFAAAVASWRLFSEGRWRRLPAVVGAIGGGYALGAFAAAHQLLPAAEAWRFAGLGRLPQTWGAGRLMAIRFAPFGLFLADFYGSWTVKQWYFHWCETCVYIGASGFALAVGAGVGRSREGRRSLAWLLLGLAFILAGTRLAVPLIKLLSAVPVLRAMRNYTRVAFLAAACFGFAAAWCVEALNVGSLTRRGRVAAVLAAVTVVAGLAGWPTLARLASAHPAVARLLDAGHLFHNWQRLWAGRARFWAQVWSPSSPYLWANLLPALALATLMALLRWLRPRSAAWLAAALVAADLAAFARLHAWTKPADEVRRAPAAVQAVRAWGGGRVVDLWHAPRYQSNLWAIWGVRLASGRSAEALWPWQLRRLIESLAQLSGRALWKMLEAWDVRFVLQRPGRTVAGGRLLARSKQGVLWAARSWPLRAWFAEETALADSPDAAIALAAAAWRSGRYRFAAVEASQVPPTASGRCAIIADEPRRVALVAHCDRPGLLVIADAFYPGWCATVDGRPAEILRVNGYFRGVVVPGGHHVIVMDYAPSSVLVGAAISVAGCLAIIALAAFGRRRSSGVV